MIFTNTHPHLDPPRRQQRGAMHCASLTRDKGLVLAQLTARKGGFHHVGAQDGRAGIDVDCIGNSAEVRDMGAADAEGAVASVEEVGGGGAV
ncbi:hypothetical protein V500_02414 [Pseudogymnoascus sp. VKM F-4518 (FW-2643)]|nr:hypothetical protein V500_02414 [Pseudogymnoascus sp. VKM F-4518 (FW-2643)]